VKKSGLQAVADELGIDLADFKTGEKVFFEAGHQNRRFVVARGVLAADGVVSLPKLKTHGLERLTGCIKNQFGCIPGVLKGEFHARLPDADDFARMLVDLNQFVHPRLYIMDGIHAMEGNGPRSGTVRPMNVLLFSQDPVALDATVCRMIDLRPEFVPTVLIGHQTGAGTYLKSDIQLTGDPLSRFRTDGFDVEKTPVTPFKETRWYRMLHRHLVAKPYIRKKHCIRCGMCVKLCPATPKALTWEDDKHELPPVYQYEHCIRCFCCQEICPESAVALRVPLLRRMINPVARWTARVQG
jgi:Pyruvate/2-oxoacid:ferredoxin oxidoreductase delta subunit